MTDLVAQLVGALDRLLNSDPDGAIATASEDELTLAANDMEADPVIREQAAAVLQARAALSAAKDGGWVAVQSEPVAWMRKWAYEGEEPQKIRNENGRMAWPSKFKFLPVTQGKCLSDDVPLYAPLPNPPKGEV